jgi:hypothetical protein
MANKIKVDSFDESDEGREILSKKLQDRRERLHEEMEARREEEIERSLEEIYRDKDGKKIDVDRININRRQGFIFWFFNLLVFSLIAIVIGLGVYYYFVYGQSGDSASLDLGVKCQESVVAGEEFVCSVDYKNSEYVALKNVSLSLSYSDNFIFISSQPQSSGGQNVWNIGRIEARSEGSVKITGKVIGKAKSSSVVLAQLSYMPENFSSEFKKEASATVNIHDIGFETDFNYANTALINQQGEVKMTFKPLSKNYFSDFIIRLEKGSNFDIKNTIVSGRRQGDKTPQPDFKIEKIKEDVIDSWMVSKLEKAEDFEIIFKVKEKTGEKENIKIFFEQNVGGKNYVFLEKDISFEVMKSDLNLSLIMNGSQSDKPINFGDQLNYSIVYSNKGETVLRDVAITVALDSDFIDWASLQDKNEGREKGNTITWTGEEISALKDIDVNESGAIDFSVNVLPFSESDLAKDFEVKAFAQYGINNSGDDSATSSAVFASQDNRSNTITSLINSDFSFKEEARYFDENNLPVGNGPLPPKVGEKTSFKIYWTINNNLHDLNEVAAETVLPDGVEWDSHNRTSVGTLSYDEANRKVYWQIGRLPITVFRADAEFNVSITPTEENKNKIMVLLFGSKTTAVDGKTGSVMEKVVKGQTTKLDGDEIANMSSDGLVR